MTYLRSLLPVSIALTLFTGCAASSNPIVLYDQNNFSKDQVVTLLPASSQGIYMVLDVDGKTAGGSCLINCMFVTPVHVSPGRHRFRSHNMQVPGYTGVTSTVVFDIEAELEAGKTYRLKVSPVQKIQSKPQEFEIIWQPVST